VETLLATTDDPRGVWAIAVDLDNFRFVNDTWGHGTGDQLLVEIARRLQSVQEPGAILARSGGDEFVLVVEAGRDEVDRLAETIRRALRSAVEVDGLEFVEVASVTTIAGGIAANVIPDRVECGVNFRYAPGRSATDAEARLAELCAGHGELRIESSAPSGAVATGRLVDALVAAGDLVRAPKQAWTPVAEFGLAGLPAVNFGPGEPAQAHRRDESVEIALLVRAYEVLRRFASAAP